MFADQIVGAPALLDTSAAAQSLSSSLSLSVEMPPILDRIAFSLDSPMISGSGMQSAVGSPVARTPAARKSSSHHSSLKSPITRGASRTVPFSSPPFGMASPTRESPQTVVARARAIIDRKNGNASQQDAPMIPIASIRTFDMPAEVDAQRLPAPDGLFVSGTLGSRVGGGALLNTSELALSVVSVFCGMTLCSSCCCFKLQCLHLRVLYIVGEIGKMM